MKHRLLACWLILATLAPLLAGPAEATVPTTAPRNDYVGNGATATYSYTFKIFAATDLRVTTRDTSNVETTLSYPADYSVTGVGSASGGTITLTAGNLTTDYALTIRFDRTPRQSTDLRNQGSFFPETHEDKFDELTRYAQQLEDVVDRSLHLPETEAGSAASTTLPVAEDRASKYLAFDASGNPVVSAGGFSTPVVTAFAETLLDDATAAAARTTLDTARATNSLTAETAPDSADLVPLYDASAAGDRKMTLANLLKVLNTLTADLTPDKAADLVLTYDNSASAVKKVGLQELPLPRSYLAGGVLSNNGSDATNDIDVAAGEARDSTNAVNIRWSALTKQLDVAWAVGTNQGGRDTGSIANGTWHVFAIRKDSDGTGDILLSTSASAPTMPSGYTYFRRIGSILRESAAIVLFDQFGDEFMRRTPVLDVNANNPGTSAVTRTLSVPTGIMVKALLNAAITETAGTTTNLYLSALDQTDLAVSESAAPLVTTGRAAGAVNIFIGAQAAVKTNTSGQIRSRVNTSGAGVTVLVATRGWVDLRGRLD